MSQQKSQLNKNLLEASYILNGFIICQLLGNTFMAYPVARWGAGLITFGLVLAAFVVGLNKWCKMYSQQGGMYDRLQHVVGFMPTFVLLAFISFAFSVGVHTHVSGFPETVKIQQQQQLQQDLEMEGTDVLFK